jgi:hypothetical protein
MFGGFQLGVLIVLPNTISSDDYRLTTGLSWADV